MSTPGPASPAAPEPLPALLPLRLGISACLLGERVRYDGGDKRAPLLCDVIACGVQWVPICPEVEIGLGTPRPPMVLLRSERGARLWTPDSGTDHTRPMRAWARERVSELAEQQVAGYVLKSRSPSCGLRGVPLHDAQGPTLASGRGLFAAALTRALPLLPVAEEHELEDPAMLTQFLRRAFFYRRWQRRHEPLTNFHRRHRALLLASGAAATRRLDRALAAGEGEDAGFADRYGRDALRLLRHVPSRRSHARNLGWAVGHLVVHVGDRQRRQNVEAYRAYARGELPWAQAAVVLRRSAQDVGHQGVMESAYLFPEPAEWELLVHLDRLQTPECAPVN
ncbi:MAG TPA: DUF523 and DUF1722 domain-containing protein [Thermoanaerobaculia bacterium]|jgi:uncharacterized protein YbbK (DUF523 family)/uncharacterized protein YbgA (DUF1722 family)|nr:DUF523 and DUF1722 domain-containing protein [Thermoanaerobaculia bacterium]